LAADNNQSRITKRILIKGIVVTNQIQYHHWTLILPVKDRDDHLVASSFASFLSLDVKQVNHTPFLPVPVLPPIPRLDV
jgi:hypothetical protein